MIEHPCNLIVFQSEFYLFVYLLLNRTQGTTQNEEVKVPCPEGIGEVLISHTVAVEPVGG